MTLVTNIKDYSDENGNKIIGVAKNAKNVRVYFNGKNCTLKINPGLTLFNNTVIRFDADNGLLEFGRSCVYGGIIRIGLDCSVVIGEQLRVTENCYLSTAEKTQILIGNDCMFAQNNQIRTDDSHPIFSIENDKRVNESQSIKIGDHVWLAAEAVVMGGADIGDGSVIGMRAIVTGKEIPKNSLAVGIPAKVVKEKIYWEKTHLNNHEPFYFPEPKSKKAIFLDQDKSSPNN